MAVQAQYLAAAFTHDNLLFPCGRSLQEPAPLISPEATMDPSAGDDARGASTSGRGVAVSFTGLGAEIDGYVRAQNERLRAELEAAGRRHISALVVLARRFATRRLAEMDAAIGLAQRRNAELAAKVQNLAIERDAWREAAREKMAMAASLRADLDNVLAIYGDSAAAAAEDAGSCCEDTGGDLAGGGGGGRRMCKVCDCSDATVVVLPCRHLSLCELCEVMVEACPVCFAVKNAALRLSSS